MKSKRGIFIVLCCLSALVFRTAESKVLVMTHAHDRPDFITLQYQSLCKFLKDDFEYVVFNNGFDPILHKKITETCRELNVSCVKIPPHIHMMPYLQREPGDDLKDNQIQYVNSLQYMLETVAFSYKGIIAILDCDVFLVRDYSIEEMLKGQDLVALSRARLGNNGILFHLQPHLLFINMATLPDRKTLNVNSGTIDGIKVGAGGYTYYYLKNTPKLKWTQMSHQAVALNEKTSTLSKEVLHAIKSNRELYRLIVELPYDIEFFGDYAFLHYRHEMSWTQANPNYIAEKQRIVQTIVDQLTDDEDGRGWRK